MSQRPDDICPRIDRAPIMPTRPASPPIYPASVWVCDDTDQAHAMLEHELPGYVYQRGGHPNADQFGEKCRQLHRAECVAVTSSGMAALTVAVLSQLRTDDHIVISNQLYGDSSLLLGQELSRLGITSSEIDTCDLNATAAAFTANTRMLLVETITNPLLRVTDIAALAQLCHSRKVKLLVDNTFATPAFCRPLDLGADFVMESVSKMINGHTDVMLGVLCGHQRHWQRVPIVLSTWGLAGSPWDCWLSSRGLATMHLRVRKAAENALAIAEFLSGRVEIERVDYPGLGGHPDHDLATRQLDGGFGTIVTFHLREGRAAANALIKACHQIPFCPSLGEVFTTLSHPESTSHRKLTTMQREALGISGGSIRLSLGIQSEDWIRQALLEGLRALN